MADDQKGVNPAENQTQQPEVPPTSDDKGAVANPSVPPTDTKQPVIEDDKSVEKDGEKYVPLSAHIAQREDYQTKVKELEAKLEQQQTTQQSTEETPPAEETPEYNWDEIFGPSQPQAKTTEESRPAPSTPTITPPENIRELNERIREMRENGDELGATWLAGQFFMGQQEAMRDHARKVVKGYDDLPLHTVSNRELQFFQQNPEALRGVLAKAKGGKPTTIASSQPSDNGNNAPPANWQELIEKSRQEGREEALSGISSQSGTSAEGTRAGTTPSGEVFELDEAGVAYMRKRGIPEEKWGLYAETLKNELEGRF